MPKRKAGVAAAAARFSKAGEIKEATFFPKRNYWYLECSYYTRKGAKADRKNPPRAVGYVTKEEAENEIDLFRFAVDKDRARNWQDFNNRKDYPIHGLHQEYVDLFAKLNGNLPLAVRTLGDFVLNVAQLNQFKRLKKKAKANNSGKKISRIEFSYNFDKALWSKEDMDTSRFTRMSTRVKLGISLGKLYLHILFLFVLYTFKIITSLLNISYFVYINNLMFIPLITSPAVASLFLKNIEKMQGFDKLIKLHLIIL